MSRSWSSAHDWKSCKGQKPFESSNLSISAIAGKFVTELAGFLFCSPACCVFRGEPCPGKGNRAHRLPGKHRPHLRRGRTVKWSVIWQSTQLVVSAGGGRAILTGRATASDKYNIKCGPLSKRYAPKAAFLWGKPRFFWQGQKKWGVLQQGLTILPIRRGAHEKA